MDLEIVRTIGTAVLMAAFVGLCAWAYSPRNRGRFEEAARLPFRDDDEPSGGPWR